MGQYWKVVNLDKREFVHPHKLGCGLKLWEQVANAPGTGAALIILCAAMPEQRGGGDLEILPGFEKIIGRWAGDRVALIGDYAEDSDLPRARDKASTIYGRCLDDDDDASGIPGKPYRDISDLVSRQIEHELSGKFEGEGWRRFRRQGEAA
jgi:hypothetical protein